MDSILLIVYIPGRRSREKIVSKKVEQGTKIQRVMEEVGLKLGLEKVSMIFIGPTGRSWKMI